MKKITYGQDPKTQADLTARLGAAQNAPAQDARYIGALGRLSAKLNKRERRAQALLAHYATCERLARHLGRPDQDGKKISVALWKIERDAHNAATAQCNGEACNGQPYRGEAQWDGFRSTIGVRVAEVLGKLPPGFFVNGDPRGYSLKIDPDNQQGAELIAAVNMPKDWGGYGILSPEITGD